MSLGEKIASGCESLMGFDPKLLRRIRPVPFPMTTADEQGGVTISWNSGNGFTGGEISFSGAKYIQKDGSSVTEGTNMVVSNIYTNPNWDKDFNERRNPKESLACVLTLVVTLNRAATIGKAEVLHVVRANEKSAPYFERFVAAGIYHYCDQNGVFSPQPIYVSNGEWVLYACRYPVSDINKVLDKYVVEDASQFLAIRYSN